MSQKTDEIRAFIAVELPKGVKSFLKELSAKLKGFGGDVRWTRPEGIHLTLKFLGNIKSEQAPALGEAIKSVCGDCRRFPLDVAGVGAFPGLGRPRVIWTGLQDPLGRLVPLAAKLEDLVAEQGFEREKRPFRPHLTLGRVKSGRVNPELVAAIRDMSDLAGPSFVAEHLVLFQSVLKPSGAEYTPLFQGEFSPE